uniref:Reverse transcriptase domain-containing protein n=1 Tax=Tanacetum cinerariifolium TaxID=118510 RepID=A0A6L2LGI8_TANCI|nr:reverse transcriptase domain-containing protein [Tanacetum cinerariifolium]
MGVPERSQNTDEEIVESLVLGQPQDEANAFVVNLLGTERTPAHSDQGYSLRGTPEIMLGQRLPVSSDPLRGDLSKLIPKPRVREPTHPPGSSSKELRQQFTTRFSTRKACFKDPMEITKVIRRANETLVAFKERWIIETVFIMGVSEVMWISSFMDAHKCPELAKRYSDKVPKMMDKMMTRLDDFVRSEEAFASTELPKREASGTSERLVVPIRRREDRFHTGAYRSDRRRNEGKNTFNPRDGLAPYRVQTLYQAPRDQRFHRPKFNLGSLTKLPKEILASEPQLNLQPPRPMQLEMALESGKLNHLIKDVRLRGKRKSTERDESWMKAAIMFPPLLMEDASDEPLFIEAVMEGYLVRRVYVNLGVSVEVMFEHCFENISPAIKSRLRETQMDLVGFARGVVKPLGKIELEVVFGDGGLFRMVMINFIVVRAPSPYNIIFGRTGLKSLHAVSSTIHSMGKFPTPRGVATLVTQSAIISECQRLERKQMVEQEVNKKINQEKEVPIRVDLTEQTLVSGSTDNNRGSLSEQCKNQLRALIKGSMDEVEEWVSAGIVGEIPHVDIKPDSREEKR